MKRSPEIEELVRSFVAALERNDVRYIESGISRQPGTVIIGTDPDEYSTDLGRTMEMFRASTPDSVLAIHTRAADLRGYEHGDVGWADGTGAFERDGKSVEVRITAVFLREEGKWLLVQNHASIGVPNDHLFDPIFRAAAAATG